MENRGSQTVRKAWYAGTWYPADPQRLRSLIQKATLSARLSAFEGVQSFGPARFWILPHAGLAYSGRGLAHLPDHVPPVISKVLLISPSHYAFLEQDRIVFDTHESYQTPLGPLQGHPVGTGGSGSHGEMALFQREHAVEMILPFLALLQERQREEIKVAMALVSQLSGPDAVSRIADRLLSLFDKQEWDKGRVLVVASSDFTHYGPSFGYTPYGSEGMDAVAQRVQEFDLERAKLLLTGQTARLFTDERKSRSTICGLAAAMIVSTLAVGIGSQGIVADYYTSRDVQNDAADNFVGYCSVLWR